ncbi:MAG TPA: serine/threonine-protein kinase [Saprospiraceae bacterium]|nr:serine/threonine-protein kinase [Saprospiraceae bacterium]HMQ85699.1 serine/threonine-protein kinase [Saprospiraceae bacterium]
MSALDWNTISQHFYRLYPLPEHERLAALEQLAQQAPDIYVEVKALLEEDQALHDILNTGAASLLQGKEEALEGQEIGVFKLERLLGKGGMGAVYLARRIDGEFEQQVALKLIPPERLNQNALQRFRKERQILAGLQHPNIAQLYDGGTTEDGHLYFTMEYIDGKSILDYCQQQPCSLKDRLHLFLQIGAAIAYAHSKMILHLDIKPGNVLVDSKRHPKVLDFGISEESLSHQGNQIHTDVSRPYTLAYAPPEQRLQQPPAITNDVYALGVLLYQLLTEQLPFSKDHYQDIQKNKEPVLPPAPSTKVSLTEAKLIRGDLDAICLKALQVAPEKRYQSVNELVADVQAHLQQRPIAVRSAPFYNTGKFILRNRQALAVLAITFLLVVGLIVYYTFQLRQERNQALAEATKTRQLMGLLTDAFSAVDPYVRQNDTLRAGTILDRASKQMELQLANQPELLAEMGLTLAGIYASINDYHKADSLASKGLNWYQQNPPADQLLLADAYFQLGEIQWGLSMYALAQQYFEQALAMSDLLEEPGKWTADCHYALGDIAIDRLDYERADSLHRLAYAFYKQHYEPPHETLAASLHALGTTQRKLENFQQSERYYLAALQMNRSLYQEPHTEIAFNLNNLASLYLNWEQPEKGLPYAEDSYQQRLSILGALHEETIASLSNLTRIYTAMGNYEKALQIRLQLLESSRKLYDDQPHLYTLFHLHSIGNLYRRLGKNREAEAYLHKAVKMARDLDYGKESVERTALFYQNLGEAIYDQKRYTEAARVFQQGLEYLPNTTPAVAVLHYHLARTYLQLGQQQKARTALKSARALLEANPTENQEVLQQIDALMH